MIEKIDFIQYRKLKNISVPFTTGVNIISGTNGTCKSSILHIISNSYQEVKADTEDLKECLSIITRINQTVNPKINNLTKGDATYNDPAPGQKGTLYDVTYDHQMTLSFRRHNARSTSRFALKPAYSSPGESLPEMPVVYLGLTRLIPIGELIDVYTNIRKNLPDNYQHEIIKEYKKLTGIEINSLSNQEITGIKKRSEFKTEQEGIDSNTISAGEDNLFVILNGLFSLKYYFNITDGKPSTLVIDEIDATLHPSLQFKLLKLIKTFSESYNIQVFLTTHSLYLLETAFKNNINIVYLKKGAGNSIVLIQTPDIYQIKMHLNNETRQSLYENRKIPIFTEDNEARLFAKFIFEYFNQQDEKFAKISSRFHFSTMSAGADNLKSLFLDEELTSTTLKAICFLDGDKDSDEKGSPADLTHRIIFLPGKDNPEQIAFKHLEYLLTNEEGNYFWDNHAVYNQGFTPEWVTENVLPNMLPLIRENFDQSLHNKRLRELQKEFFNGKCQDKTKREDIKLLFQLVIKDWIIQNWTTNNFEKFRSNLRIMFKQVAAFHNINPEDWSLAKH